jgi:hypothetical protein
MKLAVSRYPFTPSFNTYILYPTSSQQLALPACYVLSDKVKMIA